MKNSNHIKELDGIRGMAILMVIAYHSSNWIKPSEGWFTRLSNYGFAGVDLFFVVSGFLITGILLNAKNKPAYFRNFYAKRALRIWPLYYLLVLGSFALEPSVLRLAHLPMNDVALLRSGNKFMYLFLLQNLWYSRLPTSMVATWSLAIEEQFYIVWPWIVLSFSRKNLARIAGAILLLSPGLRYWALLHGIDSTSIYYETWYRLDGLAFGALIALWYQSDWFSPNRAKLAALTAVAVGVPGFIWSRERQSWPLMYSMIPLASAGVVTFAIWCYRSSSLLGRPLRTAWLQYVGKVSYCLYLVHMPVYYVLDLALQRHLARHQINSGPGVFVFSLAVGFIASLAIASLSWYGFESQILKLKGRLGDSGTFRPPDAGSVDFVWGIARQVD